MKRENKFWGKKRKKRRAGKVVKVDRINEKFRHFKNIKTEVGGRRMCFQWNGKMPKSLNKAFLKMSVRICSGEGSTYRRKIGKIEAKQSCDF